MPSQSQRKVSGRALAVAVLILFALGLAGCASGYRPTKNTIDIESSEYSRVFKAAVKILRDQGFTVDREDFRYGVITTLAVGAPTIVEPWRPGNRTTAQAIDSTLNDQRRRVAVTMEPESPIQDGADQSVGNSDKYTMRVDVQVERLQIPARHLTQSTAGRRVFKTLWSNPGKLQGRGISKKYWEPIGRDTVLERHLLAAIIRKSQLLSDALAAQ